MLLIGSGFGTNQHNIEPVTKDPQRVYKVKSFGYKNDLLHKMLN